METSRLWLHTHICAVMWAIAHQNVRIRMSLGVCWLFQYCRAVTALNSTWVFSGFFQIRSWVFLTSPSGHTGACVVTGHRVGVSLSHSRNVNVYEVIYHRFVSVNWKCVCLCEIMFYSTVERGSPNTLEYRVYFGKEDDRHTRIQR